MNIVVSIPSGERTSQLYNVITKWRKAGKEQFKVAVYTWEEQTGRAVKPLVDYLFVGKLQSFAISQNMMAREIPDWDVLICSADDLYPSFGIEQIQRVCEEYPDKVIWAKDGFLNAQPTHPIITRGWYNKYSFIFNEDYKHNFCDTDLFLRTAKAGELVKCFNIGFDHRHYYKTGKKKDRIYALGVSTYAEDQRLFEQKHPGALNIPIPAVLEVV